MTPGRKLALTLISATLAALLGPPVLAWQESGSIRFGGASPQADQPIVLSEGGDAAATDVPRRGFDHEAFESRLESLWFQRKALLADGRDSDAAEQSQLIRAFCHEEGVRRLEHMAGALLAEAWRFAEEGQYRRAMDSLSLAESVDAGRPQIHKARAYVLWKSGGGRLIAAREALLAVRAGLAESIRNLTLLNRVILVLVVGVASLVLLFSLLMLVRYHVPFRHEVEEWVVRIADERLAAPAGWAVLLLPVLLWFAAGWLALFWVVICFRFMRHAERAAAVALLVASIVAVPAYRAAVSVYGMTADPVVRTTIAAAGGEYDPDRILKLRKLVQTYPEDGAYRFLLAGLYKNGRFFDEAFAEYKQALELDANLEQAHINIGNIFYTTGQFPEAIANYGKALEVAPRSLLAYFNLHLAQSEAFRFAEAEESLNRARDIDSSRLAELLSSSGGSSGRPTVVDSSLEIASLWGAALDGRQPASGTRYAAKQSFASGLVNPISIVSACSLLACGLLTLTTLGHAPARRCIRCGRPFCHHCKSGREAHEYCSQCLHLYVLGDGLAPETKTRKLYEVEQHERRMLRARRLISIVLPGAAQLLRGRAAWGTLLLLLWLASWIAIEPAALVPLERLVGADVRLDLLWPATVPARFGVNALGALAIVTAVIVWLAGNVWFLQRRREA